MSFTELVGCELPLQLSPMGGPISDVALAAAVTNAGGFGMLGLGGASAATVEQMVAAMEREARGPFGVNFLMPFLDPAAVPIAASRCRLVDFFFADPDPALVQTVHRGGALAGWQVGSADEARAAARAGCDVVVVQGTEAGGHVRGRQPRAEVLAETVAAVSVPIVAAGGIGTSSAVKDALGAGASAARIGTRFIVAEESPAHPLWVDALIRATSDDTVLTETFTQDWDAPHRVLRAAVEAAEAAEEDSVATLGTGAEAWPVPRFSSMPPTKAVSGNIAAMCMYAGTSVQAVTKRQPAAEILAELCSEI